MQNEIPEEIKKFAESPEIFAVCESVGKDFSLHIDQIGEMDSEIRGVLLGINKSTDFTEHISNRLEISHEIAKDITDRINKEVFGILKTQMLSSQNSPIPTPPIPKTPTISEVRSIENAGGFTIDKEPLKNSDNGGVTEQDKDKILNHLENPPWRTTPEILTGQSNTREHETFTEPLVDLLLSKSTARPTEATVHQATAEAPANLPVVESESEIKQEEPMPAPVTPPPAPVAPPVTPKPVTNNVTSKRSGPDPYKEPIV